MVPWWQLHTVPSIAQLYSVAGIKGSTRERPFFCFCCNYWRRGKIFQNPWANFSWHVMGQKGATCLLLDLQAGIVVGRKKEGMASGGQQRAKAINYYKMSRMQPFLSGLASWRQQIAIASVYTSWCSSQSWDAFQHTGIAVEANQEASGFFHSGDVWPFYVASVATLYCWFYHLH